MKKIRYFIEGSLLWLLFHFFRVLPPETASNIGGWIGRSIGPRLAVSRKARRHISYAMPEKTDEQQDIIIRGMWDNLGRVIAEYPHLEIIGRDYTEIVNIDRAKANFTPDHPAVFFGAHIANWEVNGIATLLQLNQPITLTYRAPNNPWSAKMLDKARTLDGRLTAYPKERKSARLILNAMKENKKIGVLIDQKFNEGIAVDFFGHPAMTNPVFVHFCQKYKCPLIPIRIQRVKGCKFRIIPHPPMKLFDAKGEPRPVEDVLKEIHILIEAWIRDNPEQWIWLHRRWRDI